MVAAELAQQTSLEAAAQSVVDRVKRLHHDVYVSGRQRATYCSRHEDMTLLIRTLNYPLADGALTPTQGRKRRSGIGSCFTELLGERTSALAKRCSSFERGISKFYESDSYRILKNCNTLMVPSLLILIHFKSKSTHSLKVRYFYEHLEQKQFLTTLIFEGLKR